MENEKLLAKNLFDYSRTIAKPLLETVDYPWEALPKISEFIIELGKTLDPEIYEQRGENVWVAKSANVTVLDAVSKKYGHKFNYQEVYMGGCAIDKYGVPLPQETVDICKKSDSVLLSEAMQLSAGAQL